MKIPLRSNRPSSSYFFAPSRLRGNLLLLLLAGSQVLMAAPPAWWSDPQTKILDTANPATLEENYAPANLGQLKNVARQAKAHLDANLPGGAGTAINNLVASFEPHIGQSYTTQELTDLRAANYAPVNLGQLKAVAKPFYDRLLSAGYDTKANLIAHDYPSTWTSNYPWNPSTAVAENYAPANIGQLKVAFSFDASTLAPPLDTDGDGIPDSVELANGTDPNNPDQNHNGILDGLDDFDGDGVSNAAELAANTNPFDPQSVTNAPTTLVDTSGQTGLNIWTLLK